MPQVHATPTSQRACMPSCGSLAMLDVLHCGMTGGYKVATISAAVFVHDPLLAPAVGSSSTAEHPRICLQCAGILALSSSTVS